MPKRLNADGISLQGLIPQLTLIVLPLTVLLLVIALASLSLHQQAMRDLVGQRNERTARSVANSINERLYHRLATMHMFGIWTTSGLSPDQILTNNVDHSTDFDGGIAFYDATGRLIHTVDSSSFIAPPDLENLLHHASTEATLSDAFVDPKTDETMISTVIRQNQLTIVGTFSIASLVKHIITDAFLPGEEASAFIVDRSYQTLYESGTPLPMADKSMHPGLAEALRGESGTTYVQLTSIGHEHVVAYSPIAPVNWALIIEENWEHVDNPMLRTTQFAPLLLIPALLLAVSMIGFGVSQIVTPLQHLARKAAQLGQGNFKALDEPVGGVAEVRRLQTELIQMAKKVQSAQEGLHDYISAITTGQEEERRRLARDLHDDTLQSLIALNQRAQLTALSLAGTPASSPIEELQQLANQTISDLRRVIRALRPIYLEDLGLVTALEMLVRESSTETSITFEKMGEEIRLAPDVELALYRMAQECLSNVIRHAKADTASLTIQFAPTVIIMTIADNGAGFTLPETPSEFAKQGHFGLLGLHERAELISARLTIESTVGQGTRICVRLPHPPITISALT
jgi:signal transduction histidine kinase